jgi:ABC-2 type transport system permease protein
MASTCRWIAGEVHGFLGPNGAGKSTTIRVLLGLLRRDAGDVTVLGGDPWDDAVDLHARLTYVPGDVHLWPNLSGGEAIDLLGSLRGGLDQRRRDDLIERFALDPTKRCSTYSKGNRQKVALVAGLAADVELYLLDEPTSGLDPLLMRTFQDVIGEVRAAGRTVLLSSHILGEVEALCDRVSIIRDGRIVESGPLDHLRHLTRTTVSLRTAAPVPGLDDLPASTTEGRWPSRDIRCGARTPRWPVGQTGRCRGGEPRGVPADTGAALPPPLRHAVLDQPGGHVGARLVRSLTGTGRLVRLALRRDRVVGPVWVVAITGLMWATAASIVGLYQSLEERVAAATFAANSVILRIFDGPPTGTEVGSLVLQEGYWLIAVLSGLACSQAVVRHTRTEEESGRAELIGAAVVGRHAALASGVAAASIVAVGIGAGVALVLVAVGLPAVGSMLTGATLTGVGLVFAGVAAVAAQVGASARAANAAAGGVLGVAWLLRAIGDAAGNVDDSGVAVVSAWPTWVSPIGWGQQAQPFSTGRWWVLALFVVASALLVVAAHALSVRRDVGAGMFASRPGPPTASRWLRSPLGLAWRLHRTSIAVWAVALIVASAAFGGMGDSVDDLAGLSDEVRAMLEAIAPGGTLVDMFFALTAAILAVAATAFTVQALLRVRSEELSGRTEHLLGARVSRHRLLASHALVAAGGTAAIWSWEQAPPAASRTAS